MRNSSYWSGVRISRRRVLASSGAAGLGLAGLSLLSCGGDDDEAPKGKGLLSEPEDTANRAVPGGILTRAIVRDHVSFDIDSNLTDLQRSKYIYSRLTKFRPFKHPEKVQGVADGDAATSWEVSPDKLQYSFKLRKNMKFDPRPPTNGRELTVEDALASWQRYVGIGVYASQFVQSISPQAPFVTMKAPSQDTITLSSAYPYAPSTIITGYYAFMGMMPKESDGGFNAKLDARGTAAWRLQSFQASNRIEFVKNNDWYDSPKVNLAGHTEILMPEYATQLAQFTAGNLDSFGGTPLGSLINQENVLSLKKDVPSLLVFAGDFVRNSANNIRFSVLPASPFKDARVRQAVSMLIERDLLIKTIYNVDAFEAAGLPAEVRWDTGVHAGEEWWLDPKSKDFGESAKFLKYDPAEAKKLLSAAGVTGPIRAPFTWSNGYANQPYPREAEIILEMLQAKGDFKLDAAVLDHNSQYRPNVIFNNNMHEGMAYFGAGPSEPDVDVWLDRVFSPTARSNSWGPDPKMEEMLAKQRRAFDRQERAAVLNDLQKYVVGEMRACWVGGAAQSFIVHHPWLGNAGLWRVNGGGSEPNETFPFLWIDQKKK